ncbi:AbrB/MazE/SpoVT family DNA-binding domain-containing protein [Patescibacteria group bacterium]|nr:AbrB/MazE/SpoVT family DNA-binding domain-containing protein [Patescibacteria group bacterium]
MSQKIIRAGNSAAVTVPADFVKVVGVKIGDTVEVRTSPEKGQITYTFSGVRQLTINSKLRRKSQT